MNLTELVELEKSFENIFFSEKDHSYFINGVKSKGSVTQIIKKYTKPFETEKIAKIVAARDGVSLEDVLGKWEFAREYACHRGTALHSYVENFMARRKAPVDSYGIQNFVRKYPDYISVEKYYNELAQFIATFQAFYKWWKERYIIVKSELVVGDKRTGICGCIDNVSYDLEKNQLCLFDYKTNKEIKTKNKEKLLGPLSHLDNCELNIYSLQLCIYSLILSRNTSFQIKELPQILWMSSNCYELIPIKPLYEEAEFLLNEYTFIVDVQE
jgi:hypothetical protein